MFAPQERSREGAPRQSPTEPMLRSSGKLSLNTPLSGNPSQCSRASFSPSSRSAGWVVLTEINFIYPIATSPSGIYDIKQ